MTEAPKVIRLDQRATDIYTDPQAAREAAKSATAQEHLRGQFRKVNDAVNAADVVIDAQDRVIRDKNNPTNVPRSATMDDIDRSSLVQG